MMIKWKGKGEQELYTCVMWLYVVVFGYTAGLNIQNKRGNGI